MKNFYYYSESKLRYVPIKNIKLKVISFITLAAIITTAALLSGSTFNKSNELTKDEYISTESFNRLLEKYIELENEFSELSNTNNELRVAVNLDPLESEELQYGTGGSEFEDLNLTGNTSDNIEKVNHLLNTLESKLNVEKANYNEVSDKLKKNQQLFESIPAIIPSKGKLATHGYGMRMHPILGKKIMHNGIDVITNTGTQVIATGKGRVKFAGKNGGFGLCIEIDHGYGYKTIYAHLSKINVKRGQKVNRGEVIALSGNTGLSTGPHLHYEVHHKGKKLDPEDFFYDNAQIF